MVLEIVEIKKLDGKGGRESDVSKTIKNMRKIIKIEDRKSLLRLVT